MKISLSNYLSIFIAILLLGTSFSSYSQNHALIKGKKELPDQRHAREEKLDEKDLSNLSLYIDTSRIHRFNKEILQFERNDSLNTARITDIVFTGSSTIRKWITLRTDMNGLKVLNRGFGGATIPEVIYYSDILIFSHKPSKIVFYAGENDITSPRTNPTLVTESFEYFQKLVEQRLPETMIYFISLKPSPLRSKFWPLMQIINNQIELFCSKKKNCKFININNDFFDKKQQIKVELFSKDRVHLSQRGYEILTKKVLETIKMQNK